MRALVTGGCGFIGSAVTNRLVAEGDIVDVVDNLSNGDMSSLTCEFKTIHPAMSTFEPDTHRAQSGVASVITGDFVDREVLKRVRTGVYDVVYHLAAKPSVGYSIKCPAESHEENVFKTVALFKVAADSNTRVVFSSSAAVYGHPTCLPTPEYAKLRPLSPYGLQKLQCEQYLDLFHDLYDLDSISLRYFNVYGPGALGDSPYSTVIAAWCQAIHSDRSLRLDGDGKQTRDMIYIDDVVEANFLAGRNSGKFNSVKVNIASGKSCSNNEILTTLEAHLGQLTIKNAPERDGDVKHSSADVQLSEDLLGFKTRIDLAIGLRKTLRWWNTLK